MARKKTAKPKSSKSRLEWWKNDRFGMFIHWGLYSITARDMWYYSTEKVARETYEKLAKRFNPVDYDPVEWAELAAEAGMKYAVITTKHHDGYCLYDSKLTSFKSRRDLIAPWVKAFRNVGLKVGFYYSLLDWHHPHYTVDSCHPLRDKTDEANKGRKWQKYVDYLHGQVREILTNYGKIDLLWADFSMPEKGADEWQSEKLIKMARQLQPDIIVNNRLGLTGDFTTPEQYVPETQPKHKGKLMPWETCMTIGQSWGYHRQDPLNKPTQQLVRKLIDCVSKDGNFLLNVGPTPRGMIQDEFVVRLLEIGEWLRLNGEAIYGAGPSNYKPAPDCRYTQKGDKLYLHVFNWTGEHLPLAGLYGKVKHATLLSDGTDLRLRTEGRKMWVWTPTHSPCDLCPVIELQLGK